MDELVGGDGWLTRIGADDIERASAMLAELPGAHVEALADRTLQVLVPGMGAADLNEVLVKAGLRVNELMPARRNLESLYLEIMRQDADGEPTE